MDLTGIATVRFQHEIIRKPERSINIMMRLLKTDTYKLKENHSQHESCQQVGNATRRETPEGSFTKLFMTGTSVMKLTEIKHENVNDFTPFTGTDGQMRSEIS